MDKSGRYPSASQLRLGTLPTLMSCSIPDEPATELDSLRLHAESAVTVPSHHPSGPGGKSCLLCSYAAEEVRRQERIVEVDESGWVAVVPFWAVWPFELLCELIHSQQGAADEGL